MNVIRDDIRDAIEKELTNANEKHPLFHSMHEAYAVIAEEIEEAAEEMERVQYHRGMFWKLVRNDNSIIGLNHIARIKYAAEMLAIEACQIAAMCEKAAQSEAERSEKKC